MKYSSKIWYAHLLHTWNRLKSVIIAKCERRSSNDKRGAPSKSVLLLLLLQWQPNNHRKGENRPATFFRASNVNQNQNCWPHEQKKTVHIHRYTDTHSYVRSLKTFSTSHITYIYCPLLTTFRTRMRTKSKAKSPVFKLILYFVGH